MIDDWFFALNPTKVSPVVCQVVHKSMRNSAKWRDKWTFFPGFQKAKNGRARLLFQCFVVVDESPSFKRAGDSVSEVNLRLLRAVPERKNCRFRIEAFGKFLQSGSLYWTLELENLFWWKSDLADVCNLSWKLEKLGKKLNWCPHLYNHSSWGLTSSKIQAKQGSSKSWSS